MIINNSGNHNIPISHKILRNLVFWKTIECGRFYLKVIKYFWRSGLSVAYVRVKLQPKIEKNNESSSYFSTYSKYELVERKLKLYLLKTWDGKANSCFQRFRDQITHLPCLQKCISEHFDIMKQFYCTLDIIHLVFTQS